DLASNVAGLSSIALGVGVGVALVDLIDQDGAVVRRVLPQPVMVRYCTNHRLIDDACLPSFFCSTFAEFVDMKARHPQWQKLVSYCGSIDSPPFLEQKFASLMMAIEFFIRNSLVEGGLNEDEVRRLDDLPSLIGAARKDLGWTVPKHYTARS